jgi:hypothetical protein
MQTGETIPAANPIEVRRVDQVHHFLVIIEHVDMLPGYFIDPAAGLFF